MVQECEQKLLEVMEQLNANELEKIAEGDENVAAVIMLKKLGATFVMNCDNAEKALGVELFE